MKAKLRQAWVDALRSGKYPQTKGMLFRKEASALYPAGYCCLGVLCDVTPGVTRDGMYFEFEGIRMSSTLSNHFNVAVGLSAGHESKAIGLNDTSNWNFNQIADWIEANVPIDEGPNKNRTIVEA
jgi:hypothetical protein